MNTRGYETASINKVKVPGLFLLFEEVGVGGVFVGNNQKDM